MRACSFVKGTATHATATDLAIQLVTAETPFPPIPTSKARAVNALLCAKLRQKRKIIIVRENVAHVFTKLPLLFASGAVQGQRSACGQTADIRSPRRW